MFRAKLNYLFHIYDDLLSKDEIVFLNEKMKNFKPDTEPSIEKNNSYFRQYIDNNSTKIEKFIKNIDFLLKTKCLYQTTSLSGIWINKIDSNEYQVEDFHLDEDSVSTITFLNDDFDGGSFVYIQPNQNEQYVHPKKYKTIILEGSKIPHKVNHVSNGSRYTLVTFWEKKEKNKKSII